MYPTHENETGLFQELARLKDVKFGQISYLVINPGYTRGNHYHTRKEEWFCCLHGDCRMDLFNTVTKAKKELFLSESKREFIKVNPYESHKLTNIDQAKKCELIIIISEEYDERDPDTFKLEDSW